LALGGAMTAVVALAVVATRRTSMPGAPGRALGGSPRSASVATRSPVARRMYEEGLRAFNRGEATVAARLFAAALQEDTTFAMAAYYAYRSMAPMQDRALPHLERARRLARRTTERERLIVEATWADLTDEPRRLAIAESLTVRAPGEPMGHVLLGNALLWQGNFPGALVAYRQAVILDSAGLRDGVAQCAACDGMEGTIGAHLYADSLAAATRVAREWTARQPSSGRAWYALASTLALQADTSGASDALRRWLSLENAPDWQFFAAALAIRVGDFRQVDRLLDGLAHAGTDAMRREALWWLIIGRRHEGRFHDALDSVHVLRALDPDDQNVRLLQAHVLVELGRPSEAAELLDTLVRAVRAAPAASEAKRARNLAWTLTHRATALAAAGDTAPLAAIAEEVQAAGERSGYGRDRRLHHYVRGLLLTARQRPSEAIAELRRAIFSPTAGYTRVNVALAELLLARGEPREAIPLLRAALHGSLEASNLYVTHTELHALLARAFAATAEPDSAAAHSRYVQRTLVRAGTSFKFSSQLQQ
jgi:tetratricopeptide (TPR) repeat protein